MIEGDLLGLGLADEGGSGVRVGDYHGVGGGVPAYLCVQHAAQGGQGQIGGAVVEKGRDQIAVGVPDVVGGAVDLQGDVRTEGGNHVLGLADGGGAHYHAAGEGQGGGDVSFLHRRFLSFFIRLFCLPF